MKNAIQLMDEKISELEGRLSDAEDKISNMTNEIGFVRARAILLQKAVQVFHANGQMSHNASHEIRQILEELGPTG
ncbi:MAG: hypothetical protein WAK51_06625 [Opitutaceae bacterium]